MSRKRVTTPRVDDYNLGEKAIACLAMAALRATDQERERLYAEACARWSEKAVCAKFAELVSRGYMECGVSARTGWLEPKGRDALRRATGIDAPEHRAPTRAELLNFMAEQRRKWPNTWVGVELWPDRSPGASS